MADGNAMRVILTYKFAGPQATVDPEALQRLIDDLYRHLGYLAVQANELDDTLFDLYWIITQRPRAEVVEELRGRTLGVLRDRFIAVYQRIPDAALVTRVAVLTARLSGAVDARNEFLHASWAVSPEGWIQRERRPRDRPEEVSVKMYLAHIEQAADEIGAVARLLTELHDDIVQAMGGDLPPQSGEVRDGVTYPHTNRFEDWTTAK
jgi:hypothetical protein